MHVALRRHQRRVPGELLDHTRRNSSHGEMTAEGVTQTRGRLLSSEQIRRHVFVFVARTALPFEHTAESLVVQAWCGLVDRGAGPLGLAPAR
jgi:hypothetical protein